MSLTEVERVYLTQNYLNDLTDSKTMNKLIYEFLKKRTYTNYQLVVDYVKTKIDFCKLNNDVNKLTLYLLSDTGKIVVSYKNGVFSTLCDFENGIEFSNISEKEEYLNGLEQLNTTNKVDINILREPLLNVIIAGELSGTIYYMVQRRNPKSGNVFVAYVYDIVVN